MRTISQIFDGHIGHDVLTDLCDNQLMIKCIDCDEVLHEEFHEPMVVPREIDDNEIAEYLLKNTGMTRAEIKAKIRSETQ